MEVTIQHEDSFLEHYFNLFYWDSPKNLYDNNIKFEIKSTHLNILVCGAGAGILEIPLFLSLLTEYRTANIIFIDKNANPFRLLHCILQNYINNNKKEIICKYREQPPINLNVIYSTQISNCDISYSFFVSDLEFDPNPANTNYNKECENIEIRETYEDFLQNIIATFNTYSEIRVQDKFDVVIMSMLLQHISYWRSLIAYVNFYLKDEGVFFINEFGGDDCLLCLDVYRAIIDDRSNYQTELQRIFAGIVEHPFSILSDNNELTPINIELCDHFFSFLGVEGKTSDDYTFCGRLSKDDIVYQFSQPIFSPHKVYNKLYPDEIFNRLSGLSDKCYLVANFKIRWKSYSKICDKRISHFDIIRNPFNTPMCQKDMQRYINEVLDILSLNTTIYSSKFISDINLKRREYVISETIGLFRRFVLFKLLNVNIEALTIFINDIYNQSFVFPIINDNYCGDKFKQIALLKEVKDYNDELRLKNTKSINELFFDKYKNIFTRPFVILLKESHEFNEYNDNEFIYNTHYITLEHDSICDHKFDLDSKVAPSINENKKDIYDLFGIFSRKIVNKSVALAPCFRDNFTNSNVVKKEFTASFIIFFDKKYDCIVKQILPYYSWIIQKFINFSNIGNSIDFFKYKALINKESIKSAISAIMARNMSHNLGSHFISNTKNYFGQLADKDGDEQRRKDYRGIKHALQYIQERMDFIATIVSSDRFPYSPVNVKSQIFDELTPDEFGYRHGKETTNFLLDFLVYSESISKGTNEEYSRNKMILTLDLITKDCTTNKLYRFGASPKGEDHDAREVFAKRNLAVPGGVLGRHAIFTVIENVIRNSSKHDKTNIPSCGLNVSIRLNVVDNDSSNIVIFDNKGNAKNVKGNILKLYQETQILEENGSIDKGNKGLKEILIATLWLNNVNLAEWLAQYDSLKDHYEEKLKMLGQYLDIVTVDEYGEETAEASHLGYKIKIKPFNPVHSIKPSNNNFVLYSDIAEVNADIVTADNDYYVLTNKDECITDKTPKLSLLFPRFVESKDVDDPVLLMKKSLVHRGLISKDALDNISIDIVPHGQDIKSIYKPARYNIYSSDSEIVDPLAVKILYKSHLSGKEDEIQKTLDRYPNSNYIDSISGGDFTHTLTEEFFLNDELNRLKIIESALCKIVIVDERIFNNYARGQMPQNVSQEMIKEVDWSDRVNEIMDTIKNLRESGMSPVRITGQIKEKYHILLSTSDILSNKLTEHISDILQEKKQLNNMENKIVDNYEYYHRFLEKKGVYVYNILPVTGEIVTTDGRLMDLKSGEEIINSPTFFSIHLSLIEGLIKERQMLEPKAEKSFIVRDIMDSLKVRFGKPKFMMVHSGRGNLSKELEEELKDKAFMSLSAIEASLYDSKYFLSQLLCSNCYFGKGKINL